MAIDCQLERPEIVEEVEALGILIRETDSSLLVFALYRGVAEREAAARALKERLTLRVVELTLSAHQKNPVSLFRTLSPEERVCAFFYDAEEALPDLAGHVNLQREAFAELPHAVIFWVREHGLREIATHAPDFWAWRSGVFDFRSEQFSVSSTAMQTALAEPLVFRDRGDLERRISLYQGLFREYKQQKKPDESFLAGLQLKLGSAFRLLGKFDQFEACACDALERSRRAGDRRKEALALQALGILAEERWQLDEAEERYRQSLSIWEQIRDYAGLGASFHELGNISYCRHEFDQAEELSRKALEVFERLEHEPGVASVCHQLGMIAEEKREFDQAEQWYRNSLATKERLGLEQHAALDYHQLGMIAEERQQFDEAEQWYRKALEIFERLGLERYAASEYHQLGMIAQYRDQFDQAEQWYRKAMEVSERLGLEQDAADDYHQLGVIAQHGQQFDQAEQWYRKALETYEQLEHPPLIVSTLAQLGVLRRRQKRLQDAVAWFGKALAIAAEYKMRVGDQILTDLASLVKAMGEEEFTSAWREAFDGQDPPLENIRAAMEESKEETHLTAM